MSELIYLASPYTHPNPMVRKQRYIAACRAAGKLMKQGKCVFAPIPHSHAIERHFEGEEEGFDFWMAQDLPVLARCTKLVVLTLDGWEQSRGVTAEIEFARANGIPISFLDP